MSKPGRPCKYRMCPRLTTDQSGYCLTHKREVRQAQDKQRGSSSERGYNYRWQHARLHYLREHPLCVECEREGHIEAATVVDHITPHRGDYDRFWDESNWQSLCKHHHDIKTAREISGYARRG